MKGPKKCVYLMLPLQSHERLSALAQENSRSLPAYIRQILQCYLHRLDADPHDPDNWWIVR